MKKILSIILAAALVLSFAACSKKTEEPVNVDTQLQEQTGEASETTTPEEAPAQSEDPEKTPQPSKEPEKTPTPENTPEAKPAEPQAPTPEPTPVVPQAPTPAPVPEPTTVAEKLLAQFKTVANSSASATSIANTLISNPILAFNGGVIEVEEGFLTGFDNTEIKGFKEGAMFAPMIGTIPFVGYVFTLDDAASAPAFIASLKSAANLRWNICTKADEMLAGSVGNKVFFVMSPTSFEE